LARNPGPWEPRFEAQFLGVWGCPTKGGGGGRSNLERENGKGAKGWGGGWVAASRKKIDAPQNTGGEMVLSGDNFKRAKGSYASIIR